MSNRDHLPKRSQSAERHRKGPRRFQLSIYHLIHRRQAKQPGVSTGWDGECYFSNTSADSCSLALWCSGVQTDLHPSNCTWIAEMQENPLLTHGQSRSSSHWVIRKSWAWFLWWRDRKDNCRCVNCCMKAFDAYRRVVRSRAIHKTFGAIAVTKRGLLHTWHHSQRCKKKPKRVT